jgi:hypothetical protein
MTWVTWRQYRHQSALATALLAALAILLLITGLHAAQVWHSALAGCTKDSTCAGLAGLDLSLGSPLVATLVAATAAVPLLPGLFWGAPMVAHELETGTNQFAWTQSITRRRWLAVRTGWLLLAAAILAGAVSALVTWWSGPYSALQANAFQVNHFDVTGIVPIGYAIFAAALGICAGTLLRRTLPALAITLAGFAALRILTSQWLRLHYMTPVSVYSKLTAPFTPAGSYLEVSHGIITPAGTPAGAGANVPAYDGIPIPAACEQFMGKSSASLHAIVSCMAAHGYRERLTYQPASRFWAFQGIETAIFIALAAALLATTFWILNRRDA